MVSRVRAQSAAEPSRVPAFTAFIEPDPEGAEVSEDRGVTGWTSGKERVVWYGKFAAPGRVDVGLSLRLPAGSTSRLRLTVAKKTLTATATGGTDAVTLSFGSVEIPAPGYCRFVLEGLSKTGPTFGDLDALLLSGPAMSDVHFNLRPEQ